MTDPITDPQAARIEAVAQILQVLLPLGISPSRWLTRS
jgi:hypothetical protein